MKKSHCRILDTYNDFLGYWMNARFKDVNRQMELWQTCYMKKYPELLAKQVNNYQEMSVDWQEIAKKIFPQMRIRFELMHKARNNILTVCKPICEKASETLGLDFDIVFVVYVGIGCGAGWATKYNTQPAVLMGLENIAEEKWHKKSKLEGLMSHEVGHLTHMKWRRQWKSFEKAAEEPLFRLYCEGFAQRCEHLILQKETWHMKQDEEWLFWCSQHQEWLAKEFLARLKKGASVDDFFGSWFNIKGKKQTGYYLGHSFIRELEKTRSLREIALFNLNTVRKLGLQYLKFASNRTLNS